MTNEEIETLVNGEEPVYRNPSSTEINKLLRISGEGVRIIANERTKSFFVFSQFNLHYMVTKKIGEFQDIQQFMATAAQPSYILTATGIIENGKITLTDSDILKWSKYNSLIRAQIKMRNWSFCDKYLNHTVKDFLKKIKVNK